MHVCIYVDGGWSLIVRLLEVAIPFETKQRQAKSLKRKTRK